MNISTGLSNIGIQTPSSQYLTIANTTFVNFDNYDGFALDLCAFCFAFDGGFETRISGIKLIDSSRFVKFSHENEGWISDLDGSVTGYPSVIRPSSEILSPECVEVDRFSHGPIRGSVCPASMTIVRVGINNVRPTNSFRGRELELSNKHGKILVPWRDHRQTNHRGYMALLSGNDTYFLDFKTDFDATAFSLSTYYKPSGVWIHFELNIISPFDHLNINGLVNPLNSTSLDPHTSDTGSWTFSNETKLASFAISGDGSSSVYFTVDYCPIGGCPVIPDPSFPIFDGNFSRSESFWSDASFWPDATYPLETQDVYVNFSQHIILDMNVKVANIYVWGILSFDEKDVSLFANNIVVFRGGELRVGDESNPYTHEGNPFEVYNI